MKEDDVLYWERWPDANGKYQYKGITVKQVMHDVRIPWWKMLWRLITLS